VPRLAAHIDAQVELEDRLRREAESAYATARAEFDTATHGGRLLGGEVLARWQDYSVSGDLEAELRSKRPPRKGRRARKGPAETRAARYDDALREALESLVAAVADRAAERVMRAWRADPAAAALLATAQKSKEQIDYTERIFASAFGSSSSSEEGENEEKEERWRDAFIRSGDEMLAHLTRAVSAWQIELIRLVTTVGGNGQAVGPLSLVALTALLAEGSQGEDDIVSVPRRLLASALGAVAAREVVDRARANMAEHVGLLLDEELVRFTAILDAAGSVDPIAAVRLYEAEYTLEGAR
jgi:hypothetical protein